MLPTGHNVQGAHPRHTCFRNLGTRVQFAVIFERLRARFSKEKNLSRDLNSNQGYGLQPVHNFSKMMWASGAHAHFISLRR